MPLNRWMIVFASPSRDAVDVILSVGWMRHVTSNLSLGLETVGQDLEGFWQPGEAEGGARILAGPSAHLQIGSWEGGIAGGYVFRPTNSPRASAAERLFGSNRLAMQLSLGRTF